MGSRQLVPRNRPHLASEDLLGRGDVTLTITGSERKMAELMEGGRPVKQEAGHLYFKETGKPLILGLTNRRTLDGLFGHDTDKWVGQKVTLYVKNDVKLAGKRVNGIRIRSKGQGQSGLGKV